MLADLSSLSLDWLEIEDVGECFAALWALLQADKHALFVACVACTVKPQLAFEPQARPEPEATVSRLGIHFAKHVSPTAIILWSRINKSRILALATSGLSRASARVDQNWCACRGDGDRLRSRRSASWTERADALHGPLPDAAGVLGRRPCKVEFKTLSAVGRGYGGFHAVRRLLGRAWMVVQAAGHDVIESSDITAAATEGVAAG